MATAEHMRFGGWNYGFRLYYGNGCKHPQVKGELAIEYCIKAGGPYSLDLEVDLARNRKDIGRIEVVDLGDEKLKWKSIALDPELQDELIRNAL